MGKSAGERREEVYITKRIDNEGVRASGRRPHRFLDFPLDFRKGGKEGRRPSMALGRS